MRNELRDRQSQSNSTNCKVFSSSIVCTCLRLPAAGGALNDPNTAETKRILVKFACGITKPIRKNRQRKNYVALGYNSTIEYGNFHKIVVRYVKCSIKILTGDDSPPAAMLVNCGVTRD